MMGDVGFLIKVVKDGMERYLNQVFKPVDLTSSQVQVIKFIRERGEQKTTQKDIENYLQVSHPTVVGIIQRLEKKGFVRTEFEEGNQRKKYVYLTEKEQELYMQMKNSHDTMENLLTKGFTEEEAETLRQYLIRVYENVRGE